MITVNTSYTNLINQHNLAKNTNALEKATERLSTGAKINHAVDDAAGLFIESGLSSQIASLKIANDNTLLATNFLNIANGTLTTVSDCLMRMNDLATQACNSTMSADARTTLQNEMDSLVAQINQSIAGSNMNGVATLTTGAGAAPAVQAAAPIAPPAAPAQAAPGSGFIGEIDQKSQSELESAGYVACTAENLAVGGNTKFYISSAEELQALATFTNEGGTTRNRTFTLSSDIDLSSVCSSTKGSWTAIGTDSNRFGGIFDGNGHTISNLYINTVESHQGLFGATFPASIKNLGLENVDITGGNYTGGLIGNNLSTDVTNCFTTGRVSGSDYTGGLVGSSTDAFADYRNCYSTCDVFGGTYTGGFAGCIDRDITNCFATGTVHGDCEVGGFAGAVGYGNISGCYSTGDVITNEEQIGGFIGYQDTMSITNSYSTGNVYGGYYTGSFVGAGDQSKITNCYSTGEVDGANAGISIDKASFDDSVLSDSLWDKSGENPVLKLHSVGGEEPEPAPGGGGGGAIPVGSAVIRLQVGDTTDASSAIEYNSAMALDLDGLDLSTIDNARAAMSKIQTQLETVTAKQSYIGTQINRLSNIYNAQQIRIENTSAARSTIMDTDYAKEVANMVKAQILQQISVSVLTQSQKISGQIALGLI